MSAKINFDKYTNIQLEQELLRRSMLRQSEGVKLIENPDWSNVIKMCEQHIIEIQNLQYEEDNDFDHYVYEEIMKTLYGKNVFDWINARIM